MGRYRTEKGEEDASDTQDPNKHLKCENARLCCVRSVLVSLVWRLW